jgi:hypothetical protein
MRWGGIRHQLPAHVVPQGCSRPDCIPYVCVFLGRIIICRLYKLTLSDKAQVTLQLRVSLSDLM